MLDEDSNVIIQGGNGPYSNSVPAGLQGMDVAAGRHHMLVVKTDGSLLSLGANYTGLQNEPAVNNAIKGAAGWYHNAAILDDGSVIGWGGQLARAGISSEQRRGPSMPVWTTRLCSKPTSPWRNGATTSTLPARGVA